MRFYKRLYVGEEVSPEELIKIKSGEAAEGIYAICVSQKTVGMLEILSTKELFKPHSLKRDYCVIALLRGKGSAKRALTDLFARWLSSHRDLSGLKEYYNINSL